MFLIFVNSNQHRGVVPGASGSSISVVRALRGHLRVVLPMYRLELRTIRRAGWCACRGSVYLHWEELEWPSGSVAIGHSLLAYWFCGHEAGGTGVYVRLAGMEAGGRRWSVRPAGMEAGWACGAVHSMGMEVGGMGFVASSVCKSSNFKWVFVT